jgi:pyridoxal phosphate enzyme (YggS family)
MNKTLIQEIQDRGISLVAVTKKHTKEEVDALAAMGLHVFGENRVQEFLTKYDPAYTWHIIGHLQTNKVKYIIGKVDVIESVDSIKLAKEIDKHAKKHGLIQKIYAEIKVSKTDENKTGYPYAQAMDFIDQLQSFTNLHVIGLMCIASNTEDTSVVTREFDQMAALSKTCKEKYPDMTVLSMGMSNDWRLALEHGSNQIRIGTALFE